jgi:hypothetical protein
MADLRESFPTLENGSAEGAALRSVQEGEAVASKNGSLAFGFKDLSGNAIAAPVRANGEANGPGVPGFAFQDSSGNLTRPMLNAAGQVPVTLSTSGNGLYARGTVVGSSTFVTAATLTLTVDNIYDNLHFIVSCFRDSIFQVIWNNNGAETIIAEALCGSGQFTFQGALPDAEITAGASGTQQILIKAKNLVAAALSDFRASVSVNESTP